MYDESDYLEAIKFALNYPPKVLPDYYYSVAKDVYVVDLFDDGGYRVRLMGSFVRSCIKWKGVKKWVRE